MDDRDRVLKQLRRWSERLHDLTARNPLLKLGGSRVARLRIVDPPSAVLFGKLVVDENEQDSLALPLVRAVKSATPTPPSAHFIPIDSTESAPLAEDLDDKKPPATRWRIEPGDLAFAPTLPEELRRRIRRLHENARTSVQERGVTTLHLALGVMRWTDERLGALDSPLVLVPCEFENKGPDRPLQLRRADEEVEVNPALEVYLRDRHKLELPQLPEAPVEESWSDFLRAVTIIANERGWVIADEAWLSTFSFENVAIYQDLRRLEEQALAHAVVRALAQVGGSAGRSERLPEDLDSVDTPHPIPVPVLDADSSQLEALAYVGSGSHIVIHGPPGTGKSQTIANLIADALSHGKRVLFVSAKMAALDVVHRRLADLGLADFCLEAHSTKAGRRKILDELRRTLESAHLAPGARLEQNVDELLGVRNKLNDYVKALHTKSGPLELTPHKALGHLSALRSAPALRFHLPWSDPLIASRRELESRIEAIEALADHETVFRDRDMHPWRGYESPSGGAVDLDVAIEQVGTSAGAIVALLRTLGSFVPDADTLSPEELARLAPGLEVLSEAPVLPDEWWTRRPEQLRDRGAARSQIAVRLRELASLEAKHVDQVLLPPRDALERLGPGASEFRSWTRIFRWSFYRWRREVRLSLAPGAMSDTKSLQHYLARAQQILDAREWRTTKVEGAGLSPNPEELEAEARRYGFAARLSSALEEVTRPAPTGMRIVPPELHQAARDLLEKLPQRDASFAAALRAVSTAFPKGLDRGVVPTSLPVGTLGARAAELLSAIARRHEYARMHEAHKLAVGLGLNPLLEAARALTLRDACSAFKRRFYAAWTEAAVEQAPSLRNFASEPHERLLSRFAELDARLQKAALDRVREVASGPAAKIGAAEIESGEIRILRRELQKKARIKPLRKLFAEVPKTLQALKPCMLMSPLSVSSFVPADLSFDLVVFDEASQLPTSEAITSIVRARQVVVAGDAKQLPPTRFFESLFVLDDNDDQTEDPEGALEPLESLLDECVAAVPAFMEAPLRWHYRSRDERLVAFSNREFYENSLVTFPAPAAASSDTGVRFVHVADGVWDRGRSRTNRKEANRVADLVIQHFKVNPDRSLGVVAMNVSQMEAIEDAIEARVRDDRQIEPLIRAQTKEPFFVKSLENVQGDERDELIISLGYGPDPTGALALNFGPLNQDGGWRRLNVLVTRARYRTTLVASLRSIDLGGVNPNNRGALALRNYLAYVEADGRFPAPEGRPEQGETNDFEDSVRVALVDAGYVVDAQVGVSYYRIDLAVRHPADPNRYALGIECDGATYHSARTARDRDLLRQRVLAGMNWRLYRVWSTDWFRNRESALAALLNAVARAVSLPVDVPLERRSSTRGPVAGAAPDATSTQEQPSARPPPPTMPARRFEAGVPYVRSKAQLSRDDLIEASRTFALTPAVLRIVDDEGPIHEDLILERLKDLAGVQRAGTNIRKNLEHALERARVSGVAPLPHDPKFYCRNRHIDSRFRISTSDVSPRAIEWICLEEIGLAALYVVEQTLAIQRDELVRETGRALGFARLRTEAGERIGDAVERLVQAGRLRPSGPNVTLP